MIKRFYTERGMAYASSLALANCLDFEKVIDWNIEHKFFFYRMSSDMFPWMSEYSIADLPDYETIRQVLLRCGAKVALHGLRLTYHPGPFNVLAANSELVLSKTKKELLQHAEIMDLLGLPQSPSAKINIHIGGAYGDKSAALARFAENYEQLPNPIRKRITVENDDKANLFSVKDLLFLHEQTRVPVVFDYFHHTFCTGGWNEEEALLAAVSTWPKDILPVVHFSSSKKKYEDPFVAATAHADYVYERINTYGQQVDVMLEAKAKERAVMKYVKDQHVG